MKSTVQSWSKYYTETQLKSVYNSEHQPTMEVNQLDVFLFLSLYQRTPLHIAARHDYANVVKILVTNHAEKKHLR